MASQVNPDLQKVRQQASFDSEQMTHVLDGGEEQTKRRRYVRNLAKQDMKNERMLDVMENHFLSRDEKHGDAVKRAAYCIKRVEELGLTGFDVFWYKSYFFPNETNPTGLHSAMFLPTLYGQASEEQKKKYLPKAEAYEIIGTYAQTEMGHGTHVRGLETTATYDPKTEEFVIHSPTQSSLKWWPGGLGKTSNYVVCMARLLIDGKDYGVNAFMVPIRDMETHEPLPGITVGDIGPKFGYDAMDNGFLKFDHVRIPREDMLMKNATVHKDGTFESTVKNKKLSYGTMLFVRSVMVTEVGQALAQACTIATRYSCVRRQSELQPGAQEPQILDYQTQQYKLFPLIASAYAFIFTGRKLAEMYFTVNSDIMAGKTDMLPELHALSSGLKAFSTYGMMSGVEQCRLACGGLGYSHASGIPKLYVHHVPACTYEGENTVMDLQAARYLMKAYLQASAGETLKGSVAYLTEPLYEKCSITQEFSVPSIEESYKHRAARLVKETAMKLQSLSGLPQHEATNACSVELVRAAQAHCHLYIVGVFREKLQSLDPSSPVRAVLKQLFQLYALYGISQKSGEFIEDGYMSTEQLRKVNQKILQLLSDIKPNAVGLVDAFDFSDHQMSTILGRYDGQVYNNLYEWALKSPMNKKQVHDSFYKYLKPLKKSRL